MFIKLKKNIQCSRRTVFAAFLAGLFFANASYGEVRIWTRTDGSRVAGEYLKEQMDKLFIRNMDGESISIPLAELSKADLSYLRAAVLPKISLKVSTKEKKVPVPTDAELYQQEISQITLDVTMQKTSKAQFDGRLTATVMMIAQDEETARYLLLDRKRFFPVFTLENKGLYSFSMSAKVHRWEEYSGDMRAYNYVGYIVTVDGPEGTRMLSDTSLSRFKDGAAERIEKYGIFSFFDETGRKMSVPRVRYTEERNP
jgi:hypothetical protein